MRSPIMTKGWSKPMMTSLVAELITVRVVICLVQYRFKVPINEQRFLLFFELMTRGPGF
ncbi:MAG: hypothetical protein ACI9J2_002290 [Saprospiraceae bacterium]|jgi:hypothetical protein